ncbi:MAG: S1/P1 nuclease [Sphingopyxis sp.]|nr:S1/P1 nuclease [Sphingopyxis sp.]
MPGSASGSRRVAAALALAFALVDAAPGLAWSRPGHMVTAAIAWRDLEDAPALRARIAYLLAAHPDRAPFEVAIDRSTNEEQVRRRFYECARWPDDARGTVYDHPSWHYAAQALIRDGRPASVGSKGSAIDAFALNINVLRDPSATKAEQAVALCWVLHIVGDLHQPLHTGELFSRDYPEGNRLGALQYVRASPSAEPVTLHWYWDDAVHQSGTLSSVEARATELVVRYPQARDYNDPLAVSHWAYDESFPMLASLAYGPSLRSGRSPETAPVVSDDYRRAVQEAAELRAVGAGHRIAAVLRALFGSVE